LAHDARMMSRTETACTPCPEPDRMTNAPDIRPIVAITMGDASGIGRNLTIEVLEFLDRAGVTVFAGERRRLARAAAAP
jgi:hypothetical protein